MESRSASCRRWKPIMVGVRFVVRTSNFFIKSTSFHRQADTTMKLILILSLLSSFIPYRYTFNFKAGILLLLTHLVALNANDSIDYGSTTYSPATGVYTCSEPFGNICTLNPQGRQTCKMDIIGFTLREDSVGNVRFVSLVPNATLSINCSELTSSSIECDNLCMCEPTSQGQGCTVGQWIDSSSNAENHQVLPSVILSTLNMLICGIW